MEYCGKMAYTPKNYIFLPSLSLSLSDCWKRNYVKRPSFTDIVKDIKNLESSEFYTTTSHEDFRTMQSTWRGEIQKKFVEQKRMEPVSVCVCVCIYVMYMFISDQVM